MTSRIQFDPVEFSTNSSTEGHRGPTTFYPGSYDGYECGEQFSNPYSGMKSKRKLATHSGVRIAASSTYSSVKDGRKSATFSGVKMAASSTYNILGREDGGIVDILGREEDEHKSATNSSVRMAASLTYSSVKNGCKSATYSGEKMVASLTYSGVRRTGANQRHTRARGWRRTLKSLETKSIDASCVRSKP